MDRSSFITDSSSVDVLWLTPAGEVKNLTNHTLELVFATDGVEVLTINTAILTNVPPNVSVNVTPAQHALLGEGVHTYRVTLTSLDSVTTTVDSGRYTLTDALKRQDACCNVPTRQGGNPLETAIFQEITSELQGGNNMLLLTADSVTPAFTPVYSSSAGHFDKASNTDDSQIGKLLGVVVVDVAAGGMGYVMAQGAVVNPSWNFSVGNVYLDHFSLTQTPPVSGFSQIIGKAIRSTEVLIEIKQAIDL